MIILTRLNGGEFALNAELIERADATPDTVLTLTDGTKYVVAESVREVLVRMRDFRASILARSHLMEVNDTALISEPFRHGHLDADGGEPPQEQPVEPEDDNVRVLRPGRGQ